MTDMKDLTSKSQKGFLIHDTIRRKLFEFPPPSEHPEVTIYLCGLTTYDYAHLGNMRGPILFDVFRKFLKEIGYRVLFISNFTDIDDKVIKRAKEAGEDTFKLSRKFAREYLADLSALGIEHADLYPKVTYHMDDIIAYIKTIIDQGYAYEVNGNVYFDVRKFHDAHGTYGKLSRRNIEEMVTEARLEIDENKRDQLDFALWKADPGYWKSPWGEGRPGWHIECSCMSSKYLGRAFDIHSGAIDLKFPHHENEVAQSEAHSGENSFARVWMHYEFVNWKGGKLAKSGESFAVRDLFQKYNAETIRLFILSAKYRSPVEFSHEKMDEVKKSRERIDNFFFETKRILKEQIEESSHNLLNKLSRVDESGELSDNESKSFRDIAMFRDKFLDDLRDDFNTQGAMSRIFEAIGTANTLMSSGNLTDNAKEIINLAYTEILWSGRILGLFKSEWEELMQIENARTFTGKGKLSIDSKENEAQNLLEERQRLRSEKKFAEADEIRDKITALGFEVRDTPDGAVLKPID